MTPTVVVIPLRSGKPDVGEWTMIMLMITAAAALAFAISYRALSSLRWGVRWGLCTIVGGLVVYIYLSLSMPGGVAWVQAAGTGGILGSTLIGIVSGWIAALVWSVAYILQAQDARHFVSELFFQPTRGLRGRHQPVPAAEVKAG